MSLALSTPAADAVRTPAALRDGQPRPGTPAVSLDSVVGALTELVARIEGSRRRATDGSHGDSRSPAGAPVEAREADEPPLLSEGTVADAMPPALEGMLAQAAGDPLLLLTLVDAAFQARRLESNVRDVDAARRTSERAAAERERAIEDAIRQAGRGRRLPKWLKKMLKAIAVAASVIASAFTGGALAAVAIAGAVLMLSAPRLGELAVSLGMDPEKAKWLVTSLQLVGAAMSVATGGAAGASGTQAAQLAERAAELTSRIVGATSQILEGSEQVAQSVFRFRAASAQGAADLAQVRFDAASLGLNDALAALREGMRALERALESRTDLLELRSEATQAVLRRAV